MAEGKLPPNRQIIKCKWVYRTKTDSNGKLSKYKARLVACGYSQREGVDFKETFAPVVRHPTIRLLFAIAAAHDNKKFSWPNHLVTF